MKVIKFIELIIPLFFILNVDNNVVLELIKKDCEVLIREQAKKNNLHRWYEFTQF